MTEPLMVLSEVNKHFDGQQILQNISLQLKQGEITTLIGPNGAGKSTLVRIILGSLAPDSGSVRPAANLRIGYMPQKLHIDPTLPISTCRFLQLANTSHQACHGALESVGIGHLASTPIQNLSGGEMQRALLARAILRKPNLLVLDEPVQGVDVNGQNALYKMIGDLSKELNCAVLMVSHDLHIVMSATDQVVCLNHHICCHGRPEQVTQDPEYLSIFGQTAIYAHDHDHHHGMHGEIVEANGAHGSGEGCDHD
ncbi:MAG: zinc ABC transporter ATP-binding protein ZnuC [Porticoccaceae bacterium]|nr:zinc ABC transporter ATP-binding protein ZnuC [Porticoccaceae bacterium]